jgi:hypothetical protein
LRSVRARPLFTAAVAAAFTVAAGLFALLASTDASASTPSAASLAAANIGKTAGTCANRPTTNSLGGSQFEHSCAGGYSGGPEYWCADFATWVWGHTGHNTSGLTAAAQSFAGYGRSHGTMHSSARPGDAVVFSSSRGGYANHVAMVTAVNADGSVVTANGDWGGQGGSGMAHFAVTSSVVKITIPASRASVGSWVPAESYYITAIVGPAGSAGNPYAAADLCGAAYTVVDSHQLTGATIYLLYDGGSGKNCVVTLAGADTGAVPMNATLAVQGGGSTADPGSYHWYAGPVRLAAASTCVKWGGTYRTSSWTSGWSHCG